MNQVLVVDPLKCSGCRTCESACSLIHFGESGPSKSVIRVIAFKHDAFYYPHVCHQCKTPYCGDACPVDALERNLETGIVSNPENQSMPSRRPRSWLDGSESIKHMIGGKNDDFGSSPCLCDRV